MRVYHVPEAFAEAVVVSVAAVIARVCVAEAAEIYPSHLPHHHGRLSEGCWLPRTALSVAPVLSSIPYARKSAREGFLQPLDLRSRWSHRLND